MGWWWYSAVVGGGLTPYAMAGTLWVGGEACDCGSGCQRRRRMVHDSDEHSRRDGVEWGDLRANPAKK